MPTPTPPSGHEFDSKGFSFILKLLLTVALAFVAVKFVAAHVDNLQLGEEPAPLPAEEVHADSTEDDKSDYKEPRFITVTTIEEAVPEEGKFIAANLDTMELFLYEDGVEIDSFEILSRGRPGTRWDTPSGIYEISYMNPSHFSSIGHVYMPYSMQFYGNFFIHGWPYYPNGEDVAVGFSGGCIRLSTADSKAVFEFAEVGTEVFVYEKYDSEDENTPHLVTIDHSVALPSVTADSFLVADINTGQVYAEKNADTAMPIASLSKLMTALVANETIASERTVLTTERAADAIGNSADLVAGEKMTQSEMLYPLLMISGNDVAYALADHYGKSYFAFLMNKQARALGMEHTHYEESSGLSPENVSTANDIFALTRYIHERKRFLFDVTMEETHTVVSEGVGAKAHVYENIHPLRHTEGYLGGKNGYIEASKETLLTLFETNIHGDTHTIAIIVLGATDNAGDTLSLLSWVKEAAE